MDTFQKRLLYGAFTAGWTLRGAAPDPADDIEDERRCADVFVAWLDETEADPLFSIAREISHRFGYAWTDPRTGVTYPAPQNVVAPLQIFESEDTNGEEGD